MLSCLLYSSSVFYFFGVTTEKELFPNGRFSGCNLMRQSSNLKRDQFIRNMYSSDYDLIKIILTFTLYTANLVYSRGVRYRKLEILNILKSVMDGLF